MARGKTPEPWQRAALRRALVPLALLLAGLVVVLAVGGGTGQVVGWGIVGVAATIAVSLVFLEVGYSEDRERERERERDRT